MKVNKIGMKAIKTALRKHKIDLKRRLHGFCAFLMSTAF